MKISKELIIVVFLFVLGNILLVPAGIFLVSLWAEYIKPSYYYDFLFLSLYLVTLFYYGTKICFALIKGYIASPFYCKVAVFIGIAYLIQRIGTNYFLFFSFSCLPFSPRPCIAYLDFILLGVLLNVILFYSSIPQIDRLQDKFPSLEKLISSIRRLKKKDPKEDPKRISFFYTDDPEEGLANVNQSGREKAAKELAFRITRTYSKRAFAIAIEGEWGTGKTVFLKQIQKELKKLEDPDLIIIEFNPWDGNMPNSIVENFFEVLSDALGEYSSQLSWQINSYMDNLIRSNDNTLVNGILHFFKSLFGSSALSTQFKHINDTLKQLDKQLIIFIDDIDRLDKNEIYQVIKLIRNTANFHNTMFIAAFDRPYVVKALEKFNKHNHDLFLEKIFQLEIQLPVYSARNIREQFKEKLIETINECLNAQLEGKKIKQSELNNKFKHYAEVFDEILNDPLSNSSSHLPENIFDKYIKTFRDTIRFINVFKIKFAVVEGEVCFIDFLYLELLKLKYPEVCNELFFNTYHYLMKREDERNRFITISASGNSISPIDDLILRLGYALNSVDYKNIDSVMRLLFSNPHPNSDTEKSIRMPSNFHKYFSYGLFDGDFPHNEFDRLRKNSTEKDFLDQLLEWKELSLTEKIFQKFEDMKHFDDDEDVEKVLSVFFRFCDKIQRDTSYYFPFIRLVEYIHENLIINYKNDFVGFLTTLCEDKATFPFLFAQNTLYSINWIDDSEKKRQYLKYFYEHLERGDNFNEIILMYYSILKLDSNLTTSLKPLLFTFIKTKALKTFFENNRSIDHFQELSSVIKRNDGFTIEFFETQENFEKFLEELPDDKPFIVEYKDYYQQCKANSFQPISFHFKELSNPFFNDSKS